ncbi:MAG: 2OG-Fe(II) oxygenase [Pseudomonadota bacterium]|jgi:SM-20-related protein
MEPTAADPRAAIATPTRSGSVGGRQVAVFDGLLAAADVARYVELLNRAPFTRTEVARPDTAGHKHWVSEMAVAGFLKLPLWTATESAVGALRPGERYRPYRAYTNHAAFGDMLFTHTDCLPDQRELTALWFLCEQWDTEWGGETLFFSDDGDAQFVASPRPGRLVVFDGAIRHAGRPPNRVCYQPRYTFAAKLEPA